MVLEQDAEVAGFRQNVENRYPAGGKGTVKETRFVSKKNQAL